LADSRANEERNMSDWQRRLLGMGLPCLLAYALDIGLTMHGQPPEYWAGDYAQTTEGAPFHRQLYAWHPAAAALGHLVWAGILIGLLLLLPEVLAVILTITVVFGHMAGAYTWLFEGVTMGWFQTTQGFFPAAAVVLGVGLTWALSGPPEVKRANRLHPLARWGLIAVLFGCACYMVFYPH
jgi:hypothetical protein